MSNLLAATRAFALITFLFLPAIAGAVLIGLLGGGTYWFAFWTAVAFPINAIVVFSGPVRRRFWARVGDPRLSRKR